MRTKITSTIPTIPTIPLGSIHGSSQVCGCKYHCLIHPADGAYPPCIYDANIGVVSDSKGNLSGLSVKPPEPDREVLLEDGGFFIEKVPEEEKRFDPARRESAVFHYCKVFQWKSYVDEYTMINEGIAKCCFEKIPTGTIALWKMHNWEYVQKGILPFPADEACSGA